MVKDLLLEILDFYRYKIIDDKCTDADMRSVYKLLSENVIAEATIDDIAYFYRQSNSNVRNVISRNPVGEPKRNITLYNFANILKYIPKRWRRVREKMR